MLAAWGLRGLGQSLFSGTYGVAWSCSGARWSPSLHCPGMGGSVQVCLHMSCGPVFMTTAQGIADGNGLDIAFPGW